MTSTRNTPRSWSLRLDDGIAYCRHPFRNYLAGSIRVIVAAMPSAVNSNRTD
jgi:hypothetical protein